jgi:hypothetical protein
MANAITGRILCRPAIAGTTIIMTMMMMTMAAITATVMTTSIKVGCTQ